MGNPKVSAGPLETLRAAISGDVFVPGDDGYDEARRAWNLTEDQRPAVVVVPESAAEVARAVRFARAQGMRIAPQATGHGAAPLEPLEGAMLLKTSRLRRARTNCSRHSTRSWPTEACTSSPAPSTTGKTSGSPTGSGN